MSVVNFDIKTCIVKDSWCSISTMLQTPGTSLPQACVSGYTGLTTGTVTRLMIIQATIFTEYMVLLLRVWTCISLAQTNTCPCSHMIIPLPDMEIYCRSMLWYNIAILIDVFAIRSIKRVFFLTTFSGIFRCCSENIDTAISYASYYQHRLHSPCRIRGTAPWMRVS